MKDKKYFFFFINLFFIGLGIFGGVKIYQMNQDNSKYQINEVGAEPGQVITIVATDNSDFSEGDSVVKKGKQDVLYSLPESYQLLHFHELHRQ